MRNVFSEYRMDKEQPKTINSNIFYCLSKNTKQNKLQNEQVKISMLKCSWRRYVDVNVLKCNITL